MALVRLVKMRLILFVAILAAGLAKLQAGPLEADVHLTFPLPVGQIREVEVYRGCEPSSPVGEQLKLMTTIMLDKILPARVNGRYLFRDDATFSGRCGYGLRFIDSQGQRSDLSNLVYSEPIYPAKPPSYLTYEVLEDEIKISWAPPTENVDGSRPARIAGYLVNSERFITSPHLVNDEFRFGTSISYSVQTVSRRSQPVILSKASETLSLIPKDKFPPAAPANLSVLNIQGRTQLIWDVNKEADLAGYIIYRGTRPEQMEKSSALITINVYIDESVVGGQTYYYQISARDTAGNESSWSPSASIRLE